MVGKRLAAAGILAAAMAAVALWSTTALPSRPTGKHAAVSSAALRAIRRVPPAATTVALAPQRVPAASQSARVPMRPADASLAASFAVGALALLAVAGPRRSRAVTVPARPPRRGRAPPGTAAHHRAARTRDH
ncbi:hypothetical protein HC031_22175 [Planosporangium thailandense]|uniref:Uncharacterized protein n=1 Tax=Planosporangium thailandense TaxID=765197 RepID=A0ABX0Y223_9ACTN|nr:hypothetical protein [Planosporangium thailandense]NJC72404.1 hypothetical protein [Planosporangium thailandense]